MGRLSDAEIYEVIEKGGAAVDLSGAMPPWGKTLTREQIQGLVSYIRSLSKKDEKKKEVRFADLKQGGKDDCKVCHLTNKAQMIAPNLGHEGSKLNLDWLYQFLKEPSRLRPVGYMPLTKAKMPNFYFTDEEAASLAAYLMTQKDEGIASAVLPGGNLSDVAEVEKGKQLFSDKYACDACHKTGEGGGGIVGPNLSVAAKRLRPEWIFYWLKNPQAIRPDSPMPTFGIPDGEIRSLTAYILNVSLKSPDTAVGVAQPISVEGASAKKGEKLIKEKNCLFCHTLDAYNSQERKGQR